MEQTPLKVYKQIVRPGWLLEVNEVYYRPNLDAAFEIQNLRLEQQNAIETGLDASEFPRLISEYETKDAPPNPTEAPLEVQKKYVISIVERTKVFMIHKKGGVMQSIEKRPAQLKQNVLHQLKSAGTDDVAKILGRPTKVYAENLQQYNKIMPWQGVNTDKARLLIFLQNRPIATYFKNDEQAKKYQDFIRVESYLTNHTIPERAAYFLSIEYKDLLSYLSTINMNIWIHLYAQKIIEERRLKAKLSKVAKDFLTTVDRPTIQQVLQLWKKNALYNYQRHLDAEEAERQRLEQLRLGKLGQKYAILKNSNIIQQVSDKNLLDQFQLRWAQRAEYDSKATTVYNTKAQITMQLVACPQDTPVATVSVELRLFRLNNENTIDLKPLKTIQGSPQEVNLNGEVYFAQRMTARLQEKIRFEYFKWQLSDELALANGNHMTVPLNIEQFTHEDYLCVELQNGSSIDDLAISDQFTFSLGELVLYSTQGRMLWLPVQSGDPNDPIITPLQLDITFNGESFEDQFTNLIYIDSQILDPIYYAPIQFPILNKSLSKVFLRVLENNNRNYKGSPQNIEYMMFISRINDESLDRDDPTTMEIKKFLVKKIFENAFFLFNRLPRQIQIWNKLQEMSGITDMDAVVAFQMYYQSQFSILEPQIKRLCLYGIDPALRPSFWFTVCDGPKHISKVKNFLNINDTDNVSITDLYKGFLEYVKSKNLPYTQAINEQVKTAQMVGKVTQEMAESLINIMMCTCSYAESNGLSINTNYFQNYLNICNKILQMTYYHYIQISYRYSIIPFGDASTTQYYTTYKTQQERVFENETNAFWLLTVFTMNALYDYPIAGQGTQVSQDIANISIYLKKFCDYFSEATAPYEDDVLKLIQEIVQSCLSQVFFSENLYAIWDVVIYYQLRSKAEGQSSCIIPALLLLIFERLQEKSYMLQNASDVMGALQIEGNLLPLDDMFLGLLEETLAKFKHLND